MKYSQKSHSGDRNHNMTVVLFTLLCVLIGGSLALSRKAQTKTSDEQDVTPKTLPGRNGKIAFSSYRDGNSDIYTMEADGSDVQRLTALAWSPRWSPDGTKIAFVRGLGIVDGIYVANIYVMNADGTNQTRLTNNSVSDTSPDWSPDGTRIVFESRRQFVATSGNSQIYVMNADGSNQTRLTNNTGLDLFPKWSPDGTRIVFQRYTPSPVSAEIHVMNADGSNQTQLTNSGSALSPRWSPDSSRIAFYSHRDGKAQIYVMNADGSNQTRLTNNPNFDQVPEWSPDGTRIVFQSIRDNNIMNIYVMNADGNNQTRLTNNTADDNLSPIFSPDGTRIAFLSAYTFSGEFISAEISVMNADGSNPVRLDNTNVGSEGFDWQVLPQAAANPIDTVDFFVRQQYRDFLNREPDTPGLTFWTGEITECSNPEKRQPGESFIACTERKRANTSAAFFLSPEFQNTGSFVLRVYWGTLGKLPNSQCPGVPSGLPGHCRPLYTEYVAEVSQVATGIVVNNQLDPNVINANKRAFIEQFVTKPAFRTIYDSLNSQQFVDKLFETTGINASAADRGTLVNGLNGINGQPATETRSSVVFKVVDGTTTQAGGALVFNTSYGQAFYDKEFDDAFVFMEYIGYLRRNPDQGGYDHWLGKLKQYGNWQDAQMVLAFISSPEYRARFGQP